MTTLEFFSYIRSLDVKLWVEDDRLRYSSPPEALTPGLLKQLAERKSEIMAFLREASDSARSPVRLIRPVSRDAQIPLSSTQRRLWVIDRVNPNSATYNMPIAIRLKGSLKVKVLKRAFDEIIKRHEALRTSIKVIDGEPFQFIYPALSLKLPQVDLSLLPEAKREAELERLATEEARFPFDLSSIPLLRTTLVRLGEDDHVLLLTKHHIISDGWSIGILIREISLFYEAFSSGKPSPLAPLPVQFADFAVWQRDCLQSGSFDGQLAYWKRQLSGNLPLLDMPTDHPRPPVQTFNGARKQFLLNKPLIDSLKELCRREDMTLFMVLLAAYKILLCRYTNQEDILVGTIIANRNRAEIEGLIGCFVNTLVLRTDLSSAPTLIDLLKQVRKVAIDAYANQDIPFEVLLDELQQPRYASRSRLFQAMFVFQNTSVEPFKLPGLSAGIKAIETLTAKFEIFLELTEVEQEINATWEYNTDLYAVSSINLMMQHYEALLHSIVLSPERPISRLSMLTEQERRTILEEWSHSSVMYPALSCIHQLFEAQVESAPDAIAVTIEDKHVSYAELNRRANQLARYLRKLHVAQEGIVGIFMERDTELVVAILGVLKSGGAYLPIDPMYPPQRTAFMLRDASIKVILTQQSLAENLPQSEASALCLDTEWKDIAVGDERNPAYEVTPENIAYVIYTSGSTGDPKGVMINHYNVVRLMQSTQPWFNFNETDVWTLFHSYSFDFSVWEIWGALIYGGRLVIVPYFVSRSPEMFRNLLAREKVTILNQTPSAFYQLSAAEEARPAANKLSLRYVIFGGDALELGSLKPWLDCYGDEQPRLVNMYGITETTVHVSYRPLNISDVIANMGSLIGRAIPDLQLYILDRHMQPTPIGIPGEIYIGGAGLAREYYNRPDLTAERFVPNPFDGSPGRRLYKSGDQARFLPDGDIEYIGRIDRQVKIRGFRIELGEIESAMNRHEAVQQALAVVRGEAKEKRLVAYVVPRREQKLDISQLRDSLKEKLPSHMIPATFVILESLPLTSHGKIDYRLLPEPDRATPDAERPYIAPRTSTESLLAEIWEDVLQIDRVGIHDNFFDLGGDSIKSIQIQVKAQQVAMDFSVQQLFRYNTISDLAQSLSNGNGARPLRRKIEPFSLISEEDRSLLPEGVEDAYPLARLQVGMLFHSKYNPDSAVYQNVASIHMRAPFDRQRLKDAIQQVLSRHPVLRASFDLVNFSEPLQLIHESVDADLEVDDLRYLSPDAQEETFEKWFNTEKHRGFDLSRAPLLRFHTHLLSDETFQFSWAEHHAILDGWSMASLITELLQIYFASFSESPLSIGLPPEANFRDFIAVERDLLSSEEARDFWFRKLRDSNATVLPRWPSSYRANEPEQRSLQVFIPPEVSKGLKDLSRLLGVPIKSVLLATHLRVISRLVGQSDVMTGVISNGRLEEKDGERVMGLFLNTVPVRAHMSGGTWIDLVKYVFEAEQEIAPYRRYPLAELQNMMGSKAFFDTTFNFINFHIYQNVRRLKEVEFLGVKFFATTNYPLKATFSLDLASSNVQLELGYLLSEVSSKQIENISGYYVKALQEMAADPTGRYELSALLSQEEYGRLIVDWNKTKADYKQAAPIHRLFEAQAERTPEAVAVIFGGQSLTYDELNRRANRLANYLQALGVGPEALVGLYMERSPEMVIGALAILKAGGAYLPLDPQYPRERLEMMADAHLLLLLTQNGTAESVPRFNSKVVSLDLYSEEIAKFSAANPQSTLTSRNLAYVIYTSGSTGRPKGILIEHRSLVNYVEGIIRRMSLTEGMSFAMAQPLTVDASVTAFYPPLLTGGCVHLFSQEEATSPAFMSSYFDRFYIDCLKIAPSHLAALQSWSQSERLMPHRYLVIGGEAPRREWVEHIQSLAPGCRILNQYGPTEATVAMLTYWFDPEYDPGALTAIPIGMPLQNTQAYLLDEYLQPVPVGAQGELYIGGDCLARAYLNSPDLTAERFTPDPFNKEYGARLYRTGDLACHLPDGNIVFLGRADDQVKIRGFRVEPGEIEAALAQHPAVQKATVMGRGEKAGEKYLVAYVVAKQDAAISYDEMHDFLRQRLPDYMVPSAFLLLDEVPRTEHGKIDRRALPPWDHSPLDFEESFVAPRDTLELQLVQIWEKVLKVQSIGVRHNFFKVGGDSISALHLIGRIQNQLNRDIPLTTLFQSPTIEQMALALREQDFTPSPSRLVKIHSSGAKRPFYCAHAVGGTVLSYFDLARHLGTAYSFYGIQAVGIDNDEEPLTRIEDMAALYIESIREVQPRGPYLLGGWSLGGVIAFEISRQLQAQGEETPLLILIDSKAPVLSAVERDRADGDAGLVARFLFDLCGLSGNPFPELLDELQQYKSLEDQLAYIMDRASLLNLAASQTGMSHIRRLLKVFLANHQAVEKYAPSRYSGPTILFRASDVPEEFSPGDDLGWGGLIEQLEVHAVPGDHYRMIMNPNAQILAEKMMAYIDEAQATFG